MKNKLNLFSCFNIITDWCDRQMDVCWRQTKLLKYIAHCTWMQCITQWKVLLMQNRCTSRLNLSVACVAVSELLDKSNLSTSAFLLARTSFCSRVIYLINSFCCSTAKSNASNSARRSYTMLTIANGYVTKDSLLQHTGNNVTFSLSGMKNDRNISIITETR